MIFSGVMTAVCAVLFFMPTRTFAQRQTALYIDDGNGNFIRLASQSLTGGEVLTFPTTAGAAANILLSTSASGQTISGGLTVTGGLTSGAFTLPTTTGSSGDLVTSDGLGGSSWQPPVSVSPQLIDVYNAANEFVAIASNVVFNNQQYASGLTFNGTTTITVTVTGIYEINFSIYSSTAAAQFEIFLNNTGIAATHIVCGSNSLSHYSALVSCAAGDVINLRNVGGSTATLSSPLIGDVNAALEMKRVK